MTLTIPRDILDDEAIMVAVAAAVDLATAARADVSDELISTLAEALDHAFPADKLIPAPAGIVVEAIDRAVFAALIRIGVSLRRRKIRRRGKGKPIAEVFPGLEAGKP